MTLPTGIIYLSQVNDELARASVSAVNVNDLAVRTLARQLSGATDMNALRGKSRTWRYLSIITVGYIPKPSDGVGQLGYNDYETGALEYSSLPYTLNVCTAAVNNAYDYFLWVYIEGNVGAALALTSIQFDDQPVISVTANYDSNKTDTYLNPTYPGGYSAAALWNYLATKQGQRVAVKFN
jgi:hypothetical protein